MLMSRPKVKLEHAPYQIADALAECAGHYSRRRRDRRNRGHGAGRGRRRALALRRSRCGRAVQSQQAGHLHGRQYRETEGRLGGRPAARPEQRHQGHGAAAGGNLRAGRARPRERMRCSAARCRQAIRTADMDQQGMPGSEASVGRLRVSRPRCPCGRVHSRRGPLLGMHPPGAPRHPRRGRRAPGSDSAAHSRSLLRRGRGARRHIRLPSRAPCDRAAH